MQVRVTADTAGTGWIDLTKERNQVTSIVMERLRGLNDEEKSHFFVAHA
jgi:hypothetical protein